jgi:hypothetical protein
MILLYAAISKNGLQILLLFEVVVPVAWNVEAWFGGLKGLYYYSLSLSSLSLLSSSGAVMMKSPISAFAHWKIY